MDDTRPWFYLAYGLILLGTCRYAFRYGGPPEHEGATVVLGASALTFAASAIFGKGFQSIELGILLVDLTAWIVLFKLALSSNRYWPLWATGFHSIALLTHLAMFIDQSIVPQAYALGQGLWAYPVLLALLAGAARTRRMALTRRR